VTARPDIEALAPLDFHEIACQCPSHADGCTNRASFAVAIHAIGRCNQPGLDPYGNRVEILCLWCLATLRVEIGEKLARAARYGIPSCDGCGSPLASIDDVVRGVRPL
jgi:hypothetical protein